MLLILERSHWMIIIKIRCLFKISKRINRFKNNKYKSLLKVQIFFNKYSTSLLIYLRKINIDWFSYNYSNCIYRCRLQTVSFWKNEYCKMSCNYYNEYIIVSIMIVFCGIYIYISCKDFAFFVTIIKYIETYFTLENHRFQFLVDVPTRARSFCLQNGRIL